MRTREVLLARGHTNIRASHRTTLMITKEDEITRRGDCIVAVNAEKGLVELDPEIREAIQNEKARITLILHAGGLIFTVKGSGDPSLTLNHATDMVARKSRYINNRTLMIASDKAACDLDPAFVRSIQNPEQIVEITLIVET